MGVEVLIIDADSQFASELARTLQSFGVEAKTTGDAKKGLAQAATLLPRAIVLSGDLPRGADSDVLGQLKSHEFLSSVPVIVRGQETRQNAAADAFVAKPAPVSEVIDALRRYLALPDDDLFAQADAEGELLLDEHAETHGGVEATMVTAMPDLDSALKNTGQTRQNTLISKPPPDRTADLPFIVHSPPPPRPSGLPSEVPSSMHRELLELKRERNAKERQLLDLQRTLHEKETHLLTWRDREAELEARIVELEEASRHHGDAQSALEGAKNRADHRLAEVERTASRVTEDLKRRLGELTVREAELEGTNQRLSVELRTASSEVDSLQAALRLKTAELERAEERAARTEQQQNRQGAELERLSDDLATGAAAADLLRERATEAEQTVDTLREQQARLEAELAHARGEKEHALRAVEQWKAQLGESKEALRGHDKNRQKAMRALEVFLGILAEAGFVPGAPEDRRKEP